MKDLPNGLKGMIIVAITIAILISILAASIVGTTRSRNEMLKACIEKTENVKDCDILGTEYVER